MAQAPQAVGMPVEDQDPLEILRQNLSQGQVADTEEAAVKLTESSKAIVTNEAQSQSKRVMITNKSIDSLYDDISGAKYVGTMPAGSKVTAKTKNIIEKEQPDGSIQLFAKQSTPEVPPAKVFQATQEAASRPQGAVFDLANEEAKMKDLTGEDRLNAITMLLSNIDAQIVKGRQRIGQQAAIQSGFNAAQSALDKALALEQLPNPAFGGLSFAQRYGVASAQTVQAQEFLRATQIQMNQLEESMIKKDAEVMGYVSSKERLMKVEMRIGERQARSEDKATQAAAVISQQQTASWQALHPGTSAEEANKQIIAAQKNNKAEFTATQLDPNNVYATLMHPDLAVRTTALSVLRNHDRANNAGFENADKTPTTEMIKDFIKNPAALEKAVIQIGAMTAKELSELKSAGVAGSAGATQQERKSNEQKNKAILLEKYIGKFVENSYTQNMSGWKSNETAANTPLGTTIAGVAKSNLNGKADMATVVARYIGDPTLKLPDGSVMPYEQRVETLQSALNGAVGNEFRTMLYPDLSDMHAKLATLIGNMAARAYVNGRRTTMEFGGNTAGGAATGYTINKVYGQP